MALPLRRQNLSPTANLLRNSRLFSLPNPLPRPQVEAFGAGAQKVSESATLPYPTHQAIATTPRSLARGDWGLKRPLPSRSHVVQTSNPVVKVKQLDTIEHVTDFESATDHVRTREKFEELSIPMLKGMSAMREQALAIPTAGAFESWSDVTSYQADNQTNKGLDEAGMVLRAIKLSIRDNAKRLAKEKNPKNYKWTPVMLPKEDEKTQLARRNARRWKHGGPWVPGMSADEFTKYITKELSAKRDVFNLYLRQFAKSEIYAARSSAARSQNMPDNPLELDMHLEQQESEEYMAQQYKKWSDISEDQINAYIKKLRSEAAVNPLQSTLVQRLVVPFLRIPAIKLKNTQYRSDGTANEINKFRFDDDVAPLSTHPSAGLGYLRTNAYMTNHPVLGPQGERAPVKARVVEARTQARENAARLGVAGFVATDDFKPTTEKQNLHQGHRDPANEIDIHAEGGAKINILPRYASVTNDGRIHIKLNRSFGAEVNVADGQLEERSPGRTVTEESRQQTLESLTPRTSGPVLNEHSPQGQALAQLFSIANATTDPNALPPVNASGFQDFAPASSPVHQTQSFDEARSGVEEPFGVEDEPSRR